MTDIKEPAARIPLHGLGNRIKRKIFSIWFLKYELPFLAAEVITLFIAILLIARFVFVEKVFSNVFLVALGNPWKFFTFILAAFIDTHVWTKAVILLLFAGGFLLLRDVNKSIITYVLMHRKRMRV